MSENACPLPGEYGEPCGGSIVDSAWGGKYCLNCGNSADEAVWQALLAATERAESMLQSATALGQQLGKMEARKCEAEARVRELEAELERLRPVVEAEGGEK